MAEAKILGSRVQRYANVNVAVSISDVPTGAWMVIVGMLGNNTTTITPPSGWATLTAAETVGTRRVHSWWKIKQAGDPASVTFVQSNTSGGAYGIVWGTGDFASRVLLTRVRSTVGTGGSRFANIAPSISVPAKTVVVAFTAEATNALVASDEITAVAPATWPRLQYLAQPAANTDIETLGIYWNGFTAAGNTGDVTFTYSSSQDFNGWAMQIGIPGDSVVPPGGGVPGTLSWIGNWDARATKLQVVGKVANALSVSLDINGTTVATNPDPNGYFRLEAADLLPNSTYPWTLKVDGTSRQTGSTKTLPATGAHRVVFGSCLDAYTSAVFGLIAARTPDFIFWGGDRGYTFISGGANGNTSPTTADALRPLREEYYATTAARSQIDYVTPMTYIYSDCDGGGSNADSTTGGLATGAVQSVYRQQTANIDLPLAETAGRSFVIGRVRYIFTDETTMASPKAATDDASKTKLGTAQLGWLLGQISAAVAAGQAVIWFGDGPFHPPTTTSGTSNEWSRYNTERQIIKNHILTTGVKIVRANGDRHALAADNGSNNPFGGFPTVNAAPFHTTANTYGMTASEGSWPTAQTNSSRQYGVIDVADDGTTLTARFKGYSSTNSAPTEVERYNMLVDLTPEPVHTALIRSTSKGSSDGTTNQFTLTLPPGIQPGDLMVFAFFVGSSSASTNDSVPKGWWRYNAQSVNTRQWAWYARIYNPADPASVYTLSMDAVAAAVWVAHAITGHSVETSSDIQVGTNWRRGDNGGSQATIIAPSITTPSDNRLVLAVTGEASNALGARRVVNANGFTLIDEWTEGPSANLSIEWVTSWQKTQAVAGATGDMTLAWGTAEAPVISLNGVGLQISIPSGEPVAIETGLIGARVPTSVTHNSITMGVDRLSGGAVQIAAKLGATEVARQTVTIDPESGWGNATFTGLQPNSHYGFEFYVDGVLQTDTQALIQTHPTPGTPTSFKFITGSCQFTGSNHPVWDRILDEGARQLGHMGDLHYGDATTLSAWRTAVESSFTAPRMRAMLGLLPMTWSWDNHDRIITNPTGAGTGLNLGETDPATNTEWRKLAGSAGWSSPDTAGRTWVIGRVRFIQTDQWTVRDDGDGDPAPRTFLGAAQKQWFKDTLDAATEPFVVWLCQWTGQNHANGRWNSFPEETTELENFINARPGLKARMVLIGGDSHSLQVTDGTRTLAQGQRFAGIPNYNISGFNRSSDAGQGGAGWLIDQPLRVAPELEADWGGYSRLTFTDDGTTLTLLWEGVRVDKNGVTDVMYSQTLVQEPDEIPATHTGEGWVHATVEASPASGAALYGEGELQATVDVVVAADAPLSGAGALSADTEAVVEVSAPFTGSGTLTAVLAVEQIAIVAAPFTGSGVLTADTSGTMSAEIDAPFTGSGSQTASTGAELSTEIFAPFTGSGSLTASTSAELIAEAVAAFAGAGELNADTSAELVAEAQALFSGSSQLIVGIVTDQSAEVELPFSGSGEFTADITGELIAAVTATFTGQGNVTVAANTEQVIDAPFTGSGDTTAVVSSESFAVIEAAFTGAGALTAPVEIAIEIPAPFESTGNAGADLATIQDVAANFSGSGNVTAVAWALTPDGSQVYLSGKLVVLVLGGQTITISR